MRDFRDPPFRIAIASAVLIGFAAGIFHAETGQSLGRAILEAIFHR